MYATGILSFLALAGTYVVAAPVETRATTVYHAPQGKGNFTLLTLTLNGPKKFNGLSLYPFHVGAGENSLVGSTNQTFPYPGTTGYAFNTTGGDIYADISPTTPYPYGNYYFTFNGLYYSEDSFPKGYNFTGFNVGGAGGQGLSFSTDGSNILQTGSGSGQGKTFAVCDVTYAESEHGTYPTLMTRGTGVKKNASCADVHLKAIF